MVHLVLLLMTPHACSVRSMNDRTGRRDEPSSFVNEVGDNLGGLAVIKFCRWVMELDGEVLGATTYGQRDMRSSVEGGMYSSNGD